MFILCLRVIILENYSLAFLEFPLRNLNGLSWQSIQFSLVAQSCLTLYNSLNRSTPGLPVHHQFPEFTKTHVH